MKCRWIALALPVAGLLAQQPEQLSYAFNPVTIMAGGYIPNIIAHPSQAGLFYVRTDMGGAYRWDAAGQRWTQLLDFTDADHYTSWLGPESIALDPTDANKLYIATGMYNGSQGYILYSNNRGASFQFYALPPPIGTTLGSNTNGRAEGERLGVNPFKTDELFLATRRNGLWKSEDRGRSWAQVESFPVKSTSDPGLGFVLFDRFGRGRVYVGDLAEGGLYQSTDGGATWALTPGQPSGKFAALSKRNPDATRKPQKAAIDSKGILYLTIGDQAGPNVMLNGEVWKYDTNAKIWTNITPPGALAVSTGGRGGFIGIDVDTQKRDTVVVATFDRWEPVDTIYLSRDAGATWKDLGWLAKYTVNSIAKSPWLNWGGPAPKFGWWMSAPTIDPASSDHLMFATGATLYATSNLSAADGATAQGSGPYWDVEAQGIEECAILALISPSEGTHLLSGTGDVGGFKHDDFAVSPATMMTNPISGNGTGLDWAGRNPNLMVRTGNTRPNGATSADGGSAWTPFGTAVPSSLRVAISAEGGVIYLSNGQYSVDHGATFAATPTSGAGSLPREGVNAIYADKVRPKVFYAFQAGTGDFYSTYKADGSEDGHTWTPMNKFSPLPAASTGAIVPVYDIAGDIWLTQASAVYHSTDFGARWTRVNAVGKAGLLTAVMTVAVGAPGSRGAYPTLFVYGTYGGVQGIFRSTDKGATWMRASDDAHNFGGPENPWAFVADPRVFGRIYMGTNGRGIVYGDPAR